MAKTSQQYINDGLESIKNGLKQATVTLERSGQPAAALKTTAAVDCVNEALVVLRRGNGTKEAANGR